MKKTFKNLFCLFIIAVMLCSVSAIASETDFSAKVYVGAEALANGSVVDSAASVTIETDVALSMQNGLTSLLALSPGDKPEGWKIWVASTENVITGDAAAFEKDFSETVSQTEVDSLLATSGNVIVFEPIITKNKYTVTTQPTTASPTVVLNDSSAVSSYTWHEYKDSEIGNAIAGQNTATYSGAQVGTVICKVTFSDGAEALYSQALVLPNVEVSFNANGGSGTMTTVNVPRNSTYNLPVCGFTAPSGKAFEAWEVNGSTKNPGESVTIVADTEVKAKWRNLETVSAPVISPSSKVFVSSVTVDITSDTDDAIIYYTTDGTTPTTSSKVFTNALTIRRTVTIKAIAVKEGMSDSVVKSATFTNREDVPGGGTTKLPVHFDTNGGSKISSVKAVFGEPVEMPDEPTRKGYVFAGWYADEDLKEPFNSNTKIFKITTLYAAWVSEENQITLTVGDKYATVFGKTVKNDVAPELKNDRVMLPSRFVAEALGAEVIWEETGPDQGFVIITSEDAEIVITIGASQAIVNGKVVKLEHPAYISNDRTYTPIRLIAEALGAKVDWNEEDEEVIITVM